MLHILGAFSPDEYAVDAIPPDILELLRDEAPRAGSGRPPLTDLSVVYRPPPDDLLLARVGSLTSGRMRVHQAG